MFPLDLQVRESRQAEESGAAAAATARAEAAEARRALATAQGALSVAEGLEGKLADAQERGNSHRQQFEVPSVAVCG